MGGLIVGYAFRPGLGRCVVETTESPDTFRLRSLRTGSTIRLNRSNIQWRKSNRKVGSQ